MEGLDLIGEASGNIDPRESGIVIDGDRGTTMNDNSMARNTSKTVKFNLPFFELSAQRFEQLCFALLKAQGHTYVRHWGAAGGQRGCDLVSTAPDGRRWVTQAKRIQSLGPKAAVQELEKVLAYPPDPEPDVYLLAASCALSRTIEEALWETVYKSGRSWQVLLWDLAELDARIRAYPEVRQRFLGYGQGLTFTELNLPFSQLSDQQFEQLCLTLLKVKGHTNVLYWGAAGSQHGCDLVSTAPDGRRWFTQAKRTRKLSAKSVRDELMRVLDEPPTPEPDVYLLAASCALSRQTEEYLKNMITEGGKTWEVHLWGLTEFEARSATILTFGSGSFTTMVRTLPSSPN